MLDLLMDLLSFLKLKEKGIYLKEGGGTKCKKLQTVSMAFCSNQTHIERKEVLKDGNDQKCLRHYWAMPLLDCFFAVAALNSSCI